MGKWGKRIGDMGMILCLLALLVYTQVMVIAWWRWPVTALLALLSMAIFLDLLAQFHPKGKEEKYTLETQWNGRIRELILLDETDKPVKSWDLAGKTSLLIGRDNPEEPVDVDLQESEYSALIDYQHAVLNYCTDSWFVEDLNSHNGIRIRKIDDGICYKIMNSRPCRLAPGDVVYIANTKLLIT